MRTTVLEVDTNLFKQNVSNIKKYIGNKSIMPVIKANAYGTYINKRIDLINDFDIVAVAFVDEAIELRNNGFNKEIFILNPPYIEEIEDIIKYDLSIGVCEISFLEKIKNNKIKIHLEIETGMNRTGINIGDIDKFIKLIKDSNLLLEGVYTHLSSADYDYEYTNRQLELFNEAYLKLKDNFNDIKYIHTSASNGLINFKDNITNYVRPGLIMYGYESYEGINKKIDIKPICKLKTKITFLKDVKKGESIGYSRKYITKKDMKIATIQIGYADGLRRNLTGKGKVVINGKLCDIVGNICMDSCMIDVTNMDVKLYDEVYIWDNENIKVNDIASICDTINYEILSNISYRVSREFKE